MQMMEISGAPEETTREPCQAVGAEMVTDEVEELGAKADECANVDVGPRATAGLGENQGVKTGGDVDGEGAFGVLTDAEPIKMKDANNEIREVYAEVVAGEDGGPEAKKNVPADGSDTVKAGGEAVDVPTNVQLSTRDSLDMGLNIPTCPRDADEQGSFGALTDAEPTKMKEVEMESGANSAIREMYGRVVADSEDGGAEANKNMPADGSDRVNAGDEATNVQLCTSDSLDVGLNSPTCPSREEDDIADLKTVAVTTATVEVSNQLGTDMAVQEETDVATQLCSKVDTDDADLTTVVEAEREVSLETSKVLEATNLEAEVGTMGVEKAGGEVGTNRMEIEGEKLVKTHPDTVIMDAADGAKVEVEMLGLDAVMETGGDVEEQTSMAEATTSGEQGFPVDESSHEDDFNVAEETAVILKKFKGLSERYKDLLMEEDSTSVAKVDKAPLNICSQIKT